MAEDARERYIRESQRGTQFVHPFTFKQEASKYPLDPVDTSLLNTRNTQKRWERAGGSGAYPVFDPNWRMDEAPRIAPFRSNEQYNFINNPIQPGWIEAKSKWKDNIPLMLRSLRQRDEFKDWSDDELTRYMHRTFSNRGGLMSLV